MSSEQKHNISFMPFFFFITYKITTCERTLIAALQILRKHHKICGTMPGKLRGYFTNKDFPVISAGCSIPINSMSVGMISAKHPFSLNL